MKKLYCYDLGARVTPDWPGIVGLEGNLANASDRPEAAITKRIAGHHLPAMLRIAMQANDGRGLKGVKWR